MVKIEVKIESLGYKPKVGLGAPKWLAEKNMHSCFYGY